MNEIFAISYIDIHLAAAGNVDKKLAAFMLITAIIGIQIAVTINSRLFKGSGDGGHGLEGSAGANLYISLVFAIILTFVAVSMLRDIFKSRNNGGVDGGPSMKIAECLSRLRLPPVISFSMITGYATLELARESLTKGAFDFIAKPFKVKEIRKAIKKAAELLERNGRQVMKHAAA